MRLLNYVRTVQLMRCFQFVLKHKVHRHLREHKWYPNSICPSSEGYSFHGRAKVIIRTYYYMNVPMFIESFALLVRMLDQIIDFHVDAMPMLHIGCDEVHTCIIIMNT